MKMNCTKGPLTLWPLVDGSMVPLVEFRHVLDDQRQAFVASVVAAQCRSNSGAAIITPKERDANANLFAHAAEMLQLLLDQQGMYDALATLTYDEATQANQVLARRRAELLARLTEAKVIE